MRESLTLTAGTSDKFWTVETAGCDVTVHYGRRGTKGVTKTTTFATATEAEEAAAKQLRAKLAKGYGRGTEDGAAAGITLPAGGKASSASSSSSQHGPTGDGRAETEGVAAESAPAPRETLPVDGKDVGQPVNPNARDDFERDDIGLVGASPFTDGFRIENLPVTTFATQAPSLEDERARFEAIARAVPTQMYNARTAQWVFREPPFTEIPPSDVAQAWWEWIDADPLPGREQPSSAIGEVLTPIFAALRGIDWVLNEETTDFLRAFSSRALLPLAQDELAEELRARAATPLPAPVEGYYSFPSIEFVRHGVLRRGDAEVVAALDAWVPGDRYERSACGYIGHALLYPSVRQRVAAFSRWKVLFRDEPGTSAVLVAWLYATGREGLRVVLDSLEAVSGAVAEGMLNVAGALMTGPGAAAFFLDALTRNGAPAARAWLAEHVDVCLRADLDRVRAQALAPFLRGLPTGELDAAKSDAVPDVARVIEGILAERALPDAACPELDAVAVSGESSEALTDLAVRLPRIRHHDGALSPDDTVRLLAILAEGRGADLEAALATWDAASADAFATALLREWLAQGGPVKSSWMLTEGARLGGVRHVAFLAPLVERWGVSKAARAKQAVDALGANGSDAALSHLLAVTTGRNKPALRRHAKACLDAAAAARGLDRFRLADRVTPTFGLGDGPRIFSYGQRRFACSLDVAAKVVVQEIDAAGEPVGKARTTLPAARASEDAERVREVKAEFALFKKELARAVSTQARRFETAMMSGYRWAMHEVSGHIVGHPVLASVGAQLVWGVYEFGVVTMTFRFVDGRPLDADGVPVDVESDAQVGIVHAVELTPQQRDAWILTMLTAGGAAPFPQCDRAVFTLPEAQAGGFMLPGVPTVAIEVTSLVGHLARHGFERGPSRDAGLAFWYGLRVESADLTVVVSLDGGIPPSELQEHPATGIGAIVPVRGLIEPDALQEPERYGERLVPWKHVPSSVVSEVLAMLDAITASPEGEPW